MFIVKLEYENESNNCDKSIEARLDQADEVIIPTKKEIS